MSSLREPGYYHVQRLNEEWYVAYYEGESVWYLFGREDIYREDDFMEIDETPITRLSNQTTPERTTKEQLLAKDKYYELRFSTLLTGTQIWRQRQVFEFADEYASQFKSTQDAAHSPEVDKIIAENPVSTLYINAIKYCSIDGLEILIGMLNEFINQSAEPSPEVTDAKKPVTDCNLKSRDNETKTNTNE